MSDKPVVTETMLTLMRYAKNPNTVEFTLIGLKDVLGPLYSFHMRTRDVMIVVTRTYLEMVAIPQFEMPYRGDQFSIVFNLLMAPVDNNSYLRITGQLSGDNDTMTVEGFYEQILKKMLTDIMLTRCDWCRDQLGPIPAT